MCPTGLPGAGLEWSHFETTIKVPLKGTSRVLHLCTRSIYFQAYLRCDSWALERVTMELSSVPGDLMMRKPGFTRREVHGAQYGRNMYLPLGTFAISLENPPALSFPPRVVRVKSGEPRQRVVEKWLTPHERWRKCIHLSWTAGIKVPAGSASEHHA